MLRRRTNGREDADSTSEDSGVTVSQRSCWTVLSFWLKVLLFIIFTPAFLNYASLQREGQVLSSISPYALLYQPSHKDVLFFQIKMIRESLSLVCTCDRVGLGFSRRSLQIPAGTEKVWGISTTRRYESVLVVKAADIVTPFILIGSELGTLNGRFYSHIHDTQVSDLVLIDPIPEDVFEEEKWQQFWYSHLVLSLQMMQFSAAAGLSRLLIILGVLKPVFQRGDVSEELLQRQKYLLCNPAFLLISRYKLLSSKTSVHVITGESFDDQLPSDLNQVVAELQRKFLERSYPNANHIQIRGADHHMIYKNPSSLIKHTQ
uniref:AB hydrolase-1 domain-containing protein n=1 Tax=Cyprinus carpio TaxID=7962 RepID=A0A8C1Q0R7_CYPCA